MKKKKQFGIYCWSEIKQDYAPTLWPPFDSPEEARKFGNKNLKLEENLHGRSAFEVRLA
jgi:hypothetical protein